ncbi:MAG: S8 family serine peptidase [Planctomycetota bacterium JB042]
MSSHDPRSRAAAGPFLLALLLGLPAVAAPAGAESIDAAAWPAPAPEVERRVGPHLAGLLRAARRGGPVAASAEAVRRGIDRTPDGRVEVEIVGADGTVRVRALRLDEVAARLADPAVAGLRLPVPAVPTRLSEGVALTGAGLAHAAGARGEGCRLAIVDAGFSGLSELIGSGALPAPKATKDFTSSGLEKSSKHGAAVAEIAHQMAPDADLLLVKISNLSHFDDALDWVAKKKADVVNLSIGFPGSNFSDGTGTAAKAVKKVRKKGVLPVVSAGNAGDAHWLGDWSDPDGDDFLDFAPGDEGLTIEATAGSDVGVWLVWDDFPDSKIDLDLAVYWVGTAGNPVPPGPDTLQGFSTTTQNGALAPVEVVTFEAPSTGRYAAFVNRVKKSPPRIAIFASHAVVDGNGVPESSLQTPGDAAKALTVGALRVTQWTTGPVEPFSSRGPNLSGVPKPTMVGPDGTTGAVAGFDPFFGTSAAAPHVAGAACVVKSANPGLGPDGIEERLVAAALAVPGATADEAGAGRLDLGFDFMPPTPNPAEVDASSGVTADSVSLVATAAADDTPNVEYRFECVAGKKHGGDDRDWGASPTFLDEGLSPDRKLRYRVRARDGAGVPNETAWSEEATFRTRARTPGAPAEVKTTATKAKVALDVVDNPKSVEYAIRNETDGVWVNAKGKPSTEPVWRTAKAWGTPTLKGLSPATTYAVRVTARNKEKVETGLGPALMVTTDA